MSIKRALALDPALSAHLVSASRLEETARRCPTGVAAVDELLGGGWPRGALGELIGRRSSGRTALLQATLAGAIAAGETVALIDSGRAFDPRSAARAGIPLSRLLWIGCGQNEALKAADLVTAAGGFGLVALDLGEGQTRIPSAAWNRLKHAAERQQVAVIVATPWPTVGAFAATAITMARARARFANDGPPQLLALDTKAARGRGRGGKAGDPNQEAPCAWLAFSCRS